MLNILKQIAVQAGQEIMQVYESAIEVQTKDDNSPLTQADLRADRVIRTGLEKAFPDLFIWSEESSSHNDLKAERFFLVDPLDGTKEFIKRNGEFTVNIALIEQGRPTVGVVYAPALQELFYAEAGHGAWREADGIQEALKVSPEVGANGLRVLGSRSHGLEELEGWLARLGNHYELKSVGSSLKFCRIAQGNADVYPRFGPTCQWDTAAGQCIVECAGGVVLDMAGKSLVYGFEKNQINPSFVVGSSRSACGFDTP